MTASSMTPETRSVDVASGAASSAKAPSLVLPAFYFVANLASGAAVMLVEIAGARLIAPLFGNSWFMYTALITVVLLAIAVGCTFGGYLSERTDASRSLGLAFLLSGVWCLALPGISVLVYPLVMESGTLTGTALLSAALFILPGVAFGAIGTIAGRLMSAHFADRHVGVAIAARDASGALGSVLGAALPIWLVPLIGVRHTYTAAAITLLTIGILSFLLHRSKTSTAITRIIMGAAFVALIFNTGLIAGNVPSIVHSMHSSYQYLRINEREQDDGSTIRSLYLDTTRQGDIVVGTGEIPFEYQRSWRVIETHGVEVERSLVVGGGTFAVPQLIVERWPSATVRVSELDPSVIQIAREFFNLDQYSRIEAVSMDARAMVNRETDVYDFIYLDAFGAPNSIPPHLVSIEYFETVKARLETDGIVGMNLIARATGENTELFDAVRGTFAQVFGRVDVHTSSDRGIDGVENLLLLAGPGLSPLEDLAPVDAETAGILARRLPVSIYEDRPFTVLTDDNSTVDIMAQRLRPGD